MLHFRIITIGNSLSTLLLGLVHGIDVYACAYHKREDAGYELRAVLVALSNTLLGIS